MPVTIDPNIKKTKIFIDKNGNRITEEQLFANGMEHNLAGNRGAEESEQRQIKPTA